jgi:hypothetical protein
MAGMMAISFCFSPLPSWSGLSRPSTSSFVELDVQDVDARHKGEHDGMGRLAVVRPDSGSPA